MEYLTTCWIHFFFFGFDRSPLKRSALKLVPALMMALTVLGKCWMQTFYNIFILFQILHISFVLRLNGLAEYIHQTFKSLTKSFLQM